MNKELKTNVHDMAASIFTFIHENYLMRASTYDIKAALKKAAELITVLRKEDKEEEPTKDKDLPETIRKIQGIEPIKFEFLPQTPAQCSETKAYTYGLTPPKEFTLMASAPLAFDSTRTPEPTPESQIASQPVKTRKVRSDAGKPRGSRKQEEPKTI